MMITVVRFRVLPIGPGPVQSASFKNRRSDS
jgi:hypothetical protein